MNAFRERIVHKARGSGVEAVQSDACAHPQAVFTVGEHTHDDVALQRGAVSLVVEERLERIAVETVQTIVGANPHGALLVLAQAGNETAGIAVGGVVVSRLCPEQ